MERVESLLGTLMETISRDQVGKLTPLSIPVATKESRPFSASPPNSSAVQDEIGSTAGKREILRQQFVAMLPCQADVDCLFSSSQGWWLIQQHMIPHLPDLIENDIQGSFNVTTISEQHPMNIARLLLCIAICIQQLPPGMDMRKLQTAVPLREMMSGIIEFVVQKVTSDDELTGSIESVECLALLGMYEVSAGNLRRSWLSFRKAISIAQLLGLHRAASQERPDLAKTKQHYLWYQVCRGVGGPPPL